MITLENRENKLVEYEIPVAVGGGELHHVARVERVSDAAARTAAKDMSIMARKFPTTLTLTARGTKGSMSKPVPDAYANIPAVAKALLERRLIKHASNAAVDAAKSPNDGQEK